MHIININFIFIGYTTHTQVLVTLCSPDGDFSGQDPTLVGSKPKYVLGFETDNPRSSEEWTENDKIRQKPSISSRKFRSGNNGLVKVVSLHHFV